MLTVYYCAGFMKPLKMFNARKSSHFFINVGLDESRIFKLIKQPLLSLTLYILVIK